MSPEQQKALAIARARRRRAEVQGEADLPSARPQSDTSGSKFMYSQDDLDGASMRGDVVDLTKVQGNAGHLVAQGTTLGLADEIRAAGKSIPALMPGGETPGDAYSRNLQEERAAVQNYKNDHPYRSVGYEVGGAFLPALTGVGMVAGGATAAGRIGSGVVAGGIGGGIMGFNTGEGGAANRSAKALHDGAIGAAVGGGVGVLGEALRRGYHGIKGRSINTPRGGDAGERATRTVSDALKADAVEPEALKAALMAGKPQTLMDLAGRNTRAKAGAAARRSDGARGDMDRLFTGRQEAQQARVYDDIAQLNGGRDPRAFKADQAAAAAARSNTANSKYRRAYEADPVQTTPKMAELMRRPAVDKAIRSASARAAESGRDVRVSREMLDFMDRAKNETPEEREIFREVSGYRRDVQEFDDAVAGVAKRADDRYKKPAFREIIKRGGVDPESVLAGELRNIGITSRTMPGLYRRGGLRDIDNIPAEELQDALGDAVKGGGGYADRQSLLNILETEYRSGSPTRNSSQEAAQRELQDMLRSEPEIDELRGIVDDFDRGQSGRMAAIPEANLTAEGWDFVLRDLEAGIESAVRKGDTQRENALNQTRKQLYKEVEAIYPDLKSARARYAGDSEVIDAGDKGRKFLLGDSDRVLDEFDGMGDASKAAARQGASRALVDKVSRKRPEQSAADPLRTDDIQDRLGAMFPAEGVARFRSAMDAEKQMANTRNDVLGNSATAERLAADADFDADPLSKALKAISSKGIGGAVNSATGEIGQFVSDALQMGVSRKKAEEIGKLMVDPDVAAVIERLIAQRAKDAQFVPRDRTLGLSAAAGTQSHYVD